MKNKGDFIFTPTSTDPDPQCLGLVGLVDLVGLVGAWVSDILDDSPWFQ
jgi:hypothetical protein